MHINTNASPSLNTLNYSYLLSFIATLQGMMPVSPSLTAVSASQITRTLQNRSSF